MVNVGSLTSVDLAFVDLLIRNGSVIDGTGTPRQQADIAIRGDRIVAVGPSLDMTAATEINAAGQVVTPGFIDVHTHDDRLLLSQPQMTPKISQGVTTVIVGNCGISLAPLAMDDQLTLLRPPPPLDLLGDRHAYRFPSFAAYIAALQDQPPATNAALLVGHSTLRVRTMSDIDRPANPSELAAMQALLQEALDQGAIGLSTGLFYPTNRAAPAAEVIALAQLLAPAGGIYTTHMRDEGDQVEESLQEAFDTARAAGVPVIISHHKCSGRSNWGRSQQTLERIDQARQTQPVGLDVYPYSASSTVLMPDLMDEQLRIIITWSEAEPQVAGRDLADIARDWGCTVQEAAQRLQPAGAVYFQMDEADVRRILAYPHSMIGSDGLPHDQHPHPRLWGSFPRVLGHYVREVGLFSLEEAVRRMTSLPAAQFRLADRGLVQPGAYADLVLLDPDLVGDRATFDHPTQPAAGIHRVIVNGQTVWQNGSPTGARPGRVLQRPNPA